MRRSLLPLGLILGVASAAAQGLPAQEKKLRIELPAEDVKLVVQTLGAIQCPTVSQMAVCKQALSLVEDLKRQVIEQGPK